MSPLDRQSFATPPTVLRFVGPEASAQVKLMAARGSLPLPPQELAAALYILAGDPDPEVAAAAAKSLVDMPAAVLKGLLADNTTHPLILDFFARQLPLEHEFHETIALNRATDDETIIFQGTLPNKRLVDIISGNQLRILRTPKIVDALSENPLTGASVIDRMLKFVAMETAKSMPAPPPKGEGMEVESEPGEGEAESPSEEVAAVTEGGEISAVTIQEGEGVESGWASMSFHDDLLKDKLYANEQEEEEDVRNLYARINTFSVAEKVKLAMMGNKEARGLLIRDTNKVVATAVIRSARITDGEIESISKSRSVSDDIIRIIAGNKDWTKRYQVKLNLVNNSKTPMSETLKFINHLRDKELRDLSRSRNVPSQVCTAARRLMQKREDMAKGKKSGGH
jgi:hypothetical protein